MYPIISRILLGFALLTPAVSFAQPYSTLYIFGDSLSDSGNVAALTGGAQPSPVPFRNLHVIIVQYDIQQ